MAARVHILVIFALLLLDCCYGATIPRAYDPRLSEDVISTPKKRPFCNAFTGCGRKRSQGIPGMPVQELFRQRQGLGCLPGKCHLTVKSDAQPTIDAQRKVPYALQARLKEELDRMTGLGVIEPVSKPTSWVSSIVIVEKSNKQLRICLDPRNLNKAIQRSHYPLPSIEDVRCRLNGAKIYSHLDAYSGFWMIPLDSSSSDLCTFNTPYGRYKYLRLPYGLNCSTEIFSKILIESFSDIPNLIIYVDDLLIYGSDEKSHNETLKKVLERAESINLKFNKDKCIFGKTRIKFLGHVFSAEGMSPDYDRVKAICEMPKPGCQKSLQRFLGVINYLGSYIKNLSSETEVLRNLLKKDSQWLWDENHDKAFKNLKNSLTSAPVLRHYDNKKPLTLSVDSSQSALGAVLMQSGQPIAYASKTLTDCQKRYAQIEKELFAILFGCQKFHHYIYGHKVKVETDHKPLVTLFTKSLSQVPNRLQRMMLALQLYDIEVTYIPGTKLYIPDTLSRAALSESMEHAIDKEIAIHANLFITALSISQSKLETIKEETRKDACLQLLMKYFNEGWPDHKSKTESFVRSYWNYRSEIHVIDGIVFKNNSIIIPMSMRKDMLHQIHASHSGISRSKILARNVIFWPCMNKEIEQMIENCPICLKYRPANTKEPLLLAEDPSLPWEKIGADLLQFNNKKYLVIVDYYSKYIELAQLNNDSTAKNVILQFKSIFARHGIPLRLYTDNGPPFESKEFKCFCEEWDIDHVTSSPNFPQSNGQAESAVKIVKNILQKAYDENKDPYLALLHYRCNDKEYMKSPSELLMSRKLRYNLPMSKELLKPKVIEGQKERISKHKQKYKFHYDKGAKNLPALIQGDEIMFKKMPDSSWEPGVIKEVLKNCPRSYLVEADNGKLYRRNRSHILHVKSRNVDSMPKASTTLLNKSHQILKQDQSLTVPISLSSMYVRMCLPKPSCECDIQDTSTSHHQSMLNVQIDSQESLSNLELSSHESLSNVELLESSSDHEIVLSSEESSMAGEFEDAESEEPSMAGAYGNVEYYESSGSVDEDAGSQSDDTLLEDSLVYVTRVGRKVYRPKRYDD